MKLVGLIGVLLIFSSCSFLDAHTFDSRIVEAKELPVKSHSILEWGKQKIQLSAPLHIAPPKKLDYTIAGKPLLGVMIENSHVSRPFMKGLSNAKIVYEALAEGGITRFFTVFEKNVYPDLVGPVRSSREYYLDWAEEYGIPYVHIGGSPKALERLSVTKKVLNIEENEQPFYVRAKNIQRPHNAFVRLKDIFALPEIVPFKNKKSFVFLADEFFLPLKNTGLSISFGLYDYQVDYSYDSMSKKYLRKNAGKSHIDNANKQQIAVDNIIIQKTKYIDTNDEKSRLDFDTKSGGACVFLTRGTHEDCTWSFANGQTQYFANGKEIQFNDGNVWIEVVGEKTWYKISSEPVNVVKKSQ